MQPEARLVREATKYLQSIGARSFKIHGGDPMQEVGIPDHLVCYQGRFFGFEYKVPPNKPSRMQYKVLREIRASGGIGAVVTSIDDLKRIMEGPDPAWVAGFFEGEGWAALRVRDGKQTRIHIGIAQKDRTPLVYIQAYFGGYIDTNKTGHSRLRISNREEVMQFLETVQPHLKSPYKRNQVDRVWTAYKEGNH